MMKPRLPNNEEISQLTLYVTQQMGKPEDTDNWEVASSFMEGSAIAVFDDYITDCPGYVGKVMTVVWPASPDFYEVFTWDKNKPDNLTRMEHFFDSFSVVTE